MKGTVSMLFHTLLCDVTVATSNFYGKSHSQSVKTPWIKSSDVKQENSSER